MRRGVAGSPTPQVPISPDTPDKTDERQSGSAQRAGAHTYRWCGRLCCSTRQGAPLGQEPARSALPTLSLVASTPTSFLPSPPSSSNSPGPLTPLPDNPDNPPIFLAAAPAQGSLNFRFFEPPDLPTTTSDRMPQIWNRRMQRAASAAVHPHGCAPADGSQNAVFGLGGLPLLLATPNQQLTTLSPPSIA